MNINDMLSDDAFLVNFDGTSKKQVLAELCNLAEIKLGIKSSSLLENLTKREKLGSTAVGNGITFNIWSANDTDGININTAAIDIVELTGIRTGDGNLATDFAAGTGVELLKTLSSGATAASITSDGGDDDYYLIAYDTNVTVIYHVDGTTDPNVAADLIPVVMFDQTITDGAFVAADFLMV